MTPDAADTTPSEEMLVRYNADLDDAKTLSEANAISDRRSRRLRRAMLLPT